MNFSNWQWRAAFVIDVLKFALTYGGAVLTSRGIIINAALRVPSFS